MKHPPRESHQQPARLTEPETRDLALIVDNAKSMGWLAADETLVASRDAQGILVSVTNADTPRDRRYTDPARWAYQLLHDLTHGAWKRTRH